MVFFDLNIPYLEGGEEPFPDKSSKKNARLKVVVKAMEMGYTGVAYNRSIKGVMSDSDRCTISLFPLSSLLKLAPTLSTSVKFHRDLLGIPSSSPFRQYTRLTVSVASPAQASALNSGNPVLKTYDLVAVRPLNQSAFEQACQFSEVDIIAIDFSERLPFRLKLPMVKAAIGRGIYFEITYSPFISDVQTRRQLVTNTKLLVDWTRGKNLICSSSAASVNELRGPYDVANILTLLGLSVERAKLAISKNCRSLMAKAVRKKQYHKEAIRVEIIPPGDKVNSNELWFSDWNNWDPISSGEGDLLLDDIAKFFSASSKVSKNLKAIDFDSIAEGKEKTSMKLKDWLPRTDIELHTLDDAADIVSAKEINESSDTNGVFKMSEVLSVVPKADVIASNSPKVNCQNSRCEDLEESLSPTYTPSLFTFGEGSEVSRSCPEELQNSDRLDVVTSAVETLADIGYSCKTNNLLDDDKLTPLSPVNCIEPFAASNAYPKCANDFSALPLPKNCSSTEEGDLVSSIGALKHPTPIKDVDLSSLWNIDSERLNGVSLDSREQDITIKDVLIESEEWKQAELAFHSSDLPLNEDSAGQHKDGADGMQDNGTFYADGKAQVDVLVDMIEQKQAGSSLEISHQTVEESKSGRCRSKRRRPHHPFMFSLKNLLKPVLFKRKISRKSRNEMKWL